MGLLSTLGTIGGSLFGGPVGGAIGGALGGALEGSPQERAANRAAQQTGDATNEALRLQREQWMAQQAQQKPFYDAGVNALGKLQNMAEYKPFGMEQFQADPGYGFRLSQGTKALERSAAARGGLISGNTGGALQNYGQGLASQEYQNAFNRYQTERNAAMAPYMTLAGYGENAGNRLGAAGQNYATNTGNALINQGYTSGNAAIAGGNARASLYGGIGNALGQVTPGQWSSASTNLQNWLRPAPAITEIGF